MFINTRKGKLSYKLSNHERAARFFSKLKGRKTIDIFSMKKGLAAQRGLSSRWVFTKMRHEEKKNPYWMRRLCIWRFS